LAYLLPFLAVYLGSSIAFFVQPKTAKGMKLLLAFSGSFLLGVLVLEMLPQVYRSEDRYAGIWILVGILFQNLLEFFSKGAEHGHAHHGQNKQLPWVLLISLCIHAFLEGLPLTVQPTLLLAVSIHKIPIGLVVGLLLLQTNVSFLAKGAALFIFALMSPLGSYLGGLIDSPALISHIEPFIVGILFHISTTILFESSEGHNFNLQKFLSILLGIAVAAIV
jgi:zinc transporter ZupT